MELWVREFHDEKGWPVDKLRKATQDEIIEKAIAALDQQIAELPPADSAGRSHVARERLNRWVSQQVNR